MAQGYGLGNAFGDILNSYVGMKQTQQRNALAQQELDLSRQRMEADQQYRNQVLDQQNRQFYEDQYQSDLAKDQWEKTFAEENKVRQAQIGASEASRDAALAELDAARETARQGLVESGARALQNQFGSTSFADAWNSGQMDQAWLDNWLRKYGGAYGVFDFGGTTREYEGIEPILDEQGAPTGQYTIMLRNPKTGTTGPMTKEGGTDGKEEVIRFDENSLPGLMMSIDDQFNTALGTGGRATWNQVGDILNRNASVGAPDVKTQDGFNSRDAVVANSVNARAGGTRGVGDAATTRGDAGIRAIDPLAAAESDRRDAALGMVDGALNRGTVNRQLGGNELYALNMLQGLDKGGLTSEQFGNAATGDSITGGAAARNKDRLATGIQMAQDATGNIVNIDKNNKDRAADAASNSFTQSRQLKQDFDNAFDGVDEVVKEVISVYSTDMDEGYAESQAQAFKTIAAKGFNDPKSRDLYKAIIGNPTVTRTVADSWSQLERARKQLNDGDFTGSEKGFWSNAFTTIMGPAYDLANPDMAQQHIDVAMLGAVAGQPNMKAFMRDVLLPIHNQSNAKIPPEAYRSAAQLVISMNRRREANGQAPLSARDSKILIQRHLLGKGGGPKEASQEPVQAQAQPEQDRTLTRRGLR